MREELATDLLEQVANAKDADPLELPPLQEAVNPDAINKLFEHPEEHRLTLQFEYAECEVTVSSDSRPHIRVKP